MIEVNGLKKSFDGFLALSGVDMHVKKGAIYGLVGPNGAGKSTLIRHLTGIYRPDEGEVLVCGRPVFENRQIKAQMAYIPDDLFYFMQADTMEMKRFYEGIYPEFDAKLFYRLQEFFPSIDVKRNIRRLSKGMQKQVAFWLAICCKPKLMILDEPVDGLDPVMRRQIWSMILSEVAEHEMTVLVSSHNLRELEDVCDHVGIMHRGSIWIERSLSDLQGECFQASGGKYKRNAKASRTFSGTAHGKYGTRLYDDRQGRPEGGGAGAGRKRDCACGYSAADTGRNIYL